MSISSTFSPLSWRNFHLPPPKLTTFSRHYTNTSTQTLQLNSLTSKISFIHRFAFRPKLGLCVRAENGRGESKRSVVEEELRRNSTMPDRFKYLNKEAPTPPLLWPWLLAFPFLIYAWRSVLFELSNWWNIFFGISYGVIHVFGSLGCLLRGTFAPLGYLLRGTFALVFRIISDPITYTILYVKMAVHALHSVYSSIVSFESIPELNFIIMLASTVLAIGEAASPNSIKCQPYLLTAAGIIGYGAVRGFIIEPVVLLMLVGLFSFSRFFKKRDIVSSALPIATVLASIGEPWVRILAIISFTALAIYHHSKTLADGSEVAEVTSANRKVPLPLFGVAFAIGINVAAKWAGYRHLTWMIV